MHRAIVKCSGARFTVICENDSSDFPTMLNRLFTCGNYNIEVVDDLNDGIDSDENDYTIIGQLMKEVKNLEKENTRLRGLVEVAQESETAQGSEEIPQEITTENN